MVILVILPLLEEPDAQISRGIGNIVLVDIIRSWGLSQKKLKKEEKKMEN